MPTYEYVCDACSHRFDHFQSMSDKPLKKCPACGKSSLRRLIGTGAAVLFKGSGFYQTDYRSESYRSAAKADSGAGSGGGEKSTGTDSGGGEKSGGGPKSESSTASAKSESSKASTNGTASKAPGGKGAEGRSGAKSKKGG